jgi:hypothetical protein
MPPTIIQVNPQGGPLNYESDVLRVTKTNGTVIDFNLNVFSYVQKMQKKPFNEK